MSIFVSEGSMGAATSSRLLSAENAPKYMVDNPHILKAYRPVSGWSFRTLFSCLRLHNETTNIWTHAIACAFFFRRVSTSKTQARTKGGDAEAVGGLRAFEYVDIAAASMFSVSAVAHWLSPYSKRVDDVLFRLDRASIAGYFWTCGLISGYIHYVLASASATSSSSSAELSCRSNHSKTLRTWWLYRRACFASGGACTAAFLVFPGLNKATKVWLIVTQALLGLLPVFRELLYNGDEKYKKIFAKYCSLSCGWAALGGYTYARKAPERFAPGFFDLVGNSHNVMHVCVAVGAHFAGVGIRKWYTLRMQQRKGEQVSNVMSSAAAKEASEQHQQAHKNKSVKDRPKAHQKSTRGRKTKTYRIIDPETLKPPIETPGYWIERDNFVGRKSFGYFACACNKKWASAHSYPGFTQRCKGCSTASLPKFLWVNTGEKHTREFDEDEDEKKRAEHMHSLCEFCVARGCSLVVPGLGAWERSCPCFD